MIKGGVFISGVVCTPSCVAGTIDSARMDGRGCVSSHFKGVLVEEGFHLETCVTPVET